MSDISEGLSPAATGRRERNRRRTLRAIERAAIGIACEYGYASVTVAEICARADVARSTFFNYVASVDAAVFGPGLRMIPEEQAMAILDADPGNIPRALNVVSLASVGSDTVDPLVMAGRRRLVREQPETLGRWEETFSTLRHQLVDLTARWLLAHPERRVLGEGRVVREALLLANASGAVATVLMDQWADAEDAGTFAAGTADFDRGLADLKRVLAAHG
ncbi:TetR family transcriptional regulator [Streptomyces sp. MS2A]|nr:TetR family transcriptional regulator [Streptomyces sp. MS2A]